MAQLGSQTADQFRSELRNGHPFGNHIFATENRAGLIVVEQLAIDAAILAFLIPAKAAVRNRLGADELEAAQNGVLLGNEESFPQDADFHEPLKRTENLRHVVKPPKCLRFKYGMRGCRE